MREERDGPTIELLDARVVQKLRVGDYDRMHFAPPEVADWVDIDSFVFSRGAEVFPDLDPVNYRSLFAAPDDISLLTMKRDKVGVFYATNQDASYKWRVYDTIVCEVPHGGALYVLTGGSWYRIEPAFADQIAAEVAVPLVLTGWSFGADVALTIVDDAVSAWLAIAFIAARVLYPVLYIADIHWARSTIWAVGAGASFALMLLPALT